MGMLDNQGTFPVSLLFFNVSVDDDAEDMLSLYHDVTDTPRTRPDVFPPDLKNLTWSPPWSSLSRQSMFSNTGGFYSFFLLPFGEDFFPFGDWGVAGLCSSQEDPASSFEYYNKWPALLSKGYQLALTGDVVEGAVDRMEVGTDVGQRSHLWWNGTGEPRLQNSKIAQMPQDQQVFHYRFYIAEAVEDVDIMRAVQGVTDVLEASRFDNVFACGPTFTQYEGLKDLKSNLIFSAKWIVVFQFLVNWMLLGFRLAVPHTLSSTMMLMELWGLVMHFVKLNTFSAIVILMVGTVAPVFHCNLVVAFKGNAEMAQAQRLGAAMSVAVPATLQGSRCMMCLILPLLFSPSPLMVQYFAVPSIIVVCLGVIHGCIVAPAFLALVAQDKVTPLKALEDTECVGAAVEIAALHNRPNTLLESAQDNLNKSK